MVASLADAWIETQRAPRLVTISVVASLADAWIETFGASAPSWPEGRVPRGRVD